MTEWQKDVLAGLVLLLVAALLLGMAWVVRWLVGSGEGRRRKATAL